MLLLVALPDSPLNEPNIPIVSNFYAFLLQWVCLQITTFFPMCLLHAAIHTILVFYMPQILIAILSVTMAFFKTIIYMPQYMLNKTISKKRNKFFFCNAL